MNLWIWLLILIICQIYHQNFKIILIIMNQSVKISVQIDQNIIKFEMIARTSVIVLLWTPDRPQWRFSHSFEQHKDNCSAISNLQDRIWNIKRPLNVWSLKHVKPLKQRFSCFICSYGPQCGVQGNKPTVVDMSPMKS